MDGLSILCTLEIISTTGHSQSVLTKKGWGGLQKLTKVEVKMSREEGGGGGGGVSELAKVHINFRMKNQCSKITSMHDSMFN